MRNFVYERHFPQVFISYGAACGYLGRWEDEIRILEEGRKELEHRDFRYYFEEKATINDMLVRAYLRKLRLEDARKAAREVVFNKLYPFNRIHYSGYEMYGFRAVSDYSLADLKNGTLSLCSPSEFNDPVATPLFPMFHYQREEVSFHSKGARRAYEVGYLNVMEEAYANIRARCLVRNIRVPEKEGRDVAVPMDYDREYANTLMWSHYANYHKGFCVKYIMDSSFTSSEPEDDEVIILRPIEYVANFPMTDGWGNVRKDMSYLDAFLTKDRKWEYEHEHRLIYYNRKGSPAYPTPKLPEGCVKAVYIGVRCSDSDRRRILMELNDHPEVEIYQMKVSSEDLYKLVTVKIYPLEQNSPTPFKMNVSRSVGRGMKRRRK